MSLRRRNTRKDQALDAVASVTKTWSEWQLAKRAGKGVAKAKEVRPSKIKGALTSTPAKIAGALAIVGGAGAVVMRKLKGDSAADYTGPAPSEAVEASKSAPEPEYPPPVAMAPDPATEPSAGKEPAVPDTALRYQSSMPSAADTPDDATPPEPDFAAAAAAEPETADEPEPVALVEDGAATNGDGGDAADEPAGATALREAGAEPPDASDDDDDK